MQGADEEQLVHLVSLLDCDVDVARSCLLRAKGNLDAAVGFVFERTKVVSSHTGSASSSKSGPHQPKGSHIVSGTATPMVIDLEESDTELEPLSGSRSSGGQSPATGSATSSRRGPRLELFNCAHHWIIQNPDVKARIVSEDADNACLVVELWGKQLQVYLPQDKASGFFVTTDDDDPSLNSGLADLNDMPQLRTMQELLKRVSSLCRGKVVDSSGDCGLLSGSFASGVCNKRPHSPSAVALDSERLRLVQHQLIEKVSLAIGTERCVTVLLLLHTRWDDAELLRRFSVDSTSLLAASGVQLPISRVSTSGPVVDDVQLCSVCFVDKPAACLPCGHGLCSDDWQSFLRCNLETGTVGGENCLRLKCPGERCSLITPPSLFKRFLSPTNYGRYERLLEMSFKNDNDNIIRCPAPSCEMCFRLSECGSTVLCRCGHTFCSSCKLDAHVPATCSNAKTWLERKEQSSEQKKTSKGPADNKPCPNPKCGVLTHKEVGCNYLSCTHCRERWCWQCGDWGGGPSGRPEPHHVYACNNPINEEWNKKAAHSDLFLNEGRWWFYSERHNNHLKSLAFAEKLRTRLAAMKNDINNALEFTPHDSQLVRDATELLIESRHVLAWTYVWAFFQKDEAKRRLFEFTQQDLETKTEQLSAMIEDRPTAEVLAERIRLADFVVVLRGYLENIKRYGEDDNNDEALGSDRLAPGKAAKRRRDEAGGKAATGRGKHQDVTEEATKKRRDKAGGSTKKSRK